ncbi:MAG: glucosamine-6-phosphate deaminase [Acutalibacteraceae bacterium]
MQPIQSFTQDKLSVRIYHDRTQMGTAAAQDIAACIAALLSEKEEINMVFAAAPSQNDMLAALVQIPLPWERINAFHMDEYVGLSKEHPCSFAQYLREHIFGLVPFKNIYYISDYGESYGELLRENPTDIVCLGIGENGHIAFNDPGVADFHDPLRIKKAKLDDVCRMQQVHDGCFPTFDDVPQYALTLTVPQMISAQHMFCVVPAATKANAVAAMLDGAVTDRCPASILREHPHAVLYCDRDSGARILTEKR